MTDKQIFRAFNCSHSAVTNKLITPVQVFVSSSIDGNPAKSGYAYPALWDTGATGTVITKKVVDALRLIPTGKHEVSGVNSKTLVNSYVVDLILPNAVAIVDVRVFESELNDPTIEMIIGMDIIQMGDTAISNGGGKTLFSFCIPSHKNPVDLLEKSERVNPKRKF